MTTGCLAAKVQTLVEVEAEAVLGEELEAVAEGCSWQELTLQY
jgi:hypothetical protein